MKIVHTHHGRKIRIYEHHDAKAKSQQWGRYTIDFARRFINPLIDHDKAEICLEHYILTVIYITSIYVIKAVLHG